MPVLLPPSGLTYTTNGVGSIIITFFPVTGAVSYNIYKRVNMLASFAPPINQTPLLTNTFTDIAPLAGQVNYYNVTTINASGESLPSQTLVVDLTVIGGLPRVDPKLAWFNKFIDDRGYSVLWERAMVCPCSVAGKSVTDASDLNHVLCKNKQHIWTPEGNITCGITRMSRNSNLGQDAIWEIGMFFITSLSTTKLGFYDRLTFNDSTVPFSQALTKGANNGVDDLKFPAISVDLPIVDYNGNKYKYGVDFGLDSNGNIKWGGFSNTQPPTGTNYALVYETAPRILIVDYAHAVRGQKVLNGSLAPTYQDFPLQTMGKLEFFFNE